MSLKFITVSSGYGANTKEPYVEIEWAEDQKTQISPEETRDLALNLLQAAEASLSDALFVEWLKDEMDVGLDGAAQLLVMLRKRREERYES